MKTLITIILFLASLTASAVELPRTFDFRTDSIVLNHEYRAAWIATVEGIDWPEISDDAQTQEAELVKLIRDLAKIGCNAVFFQVMSNQDAMYRSNILPWSCYLNGIEGYNPGFDPLQVAVRTARECGMQIHAWINPLRAGSAEKLHDASSVVVRHPEWIQTYKGKLYLDPGFPEVREYLASIASELMSGYDIDGIHIDDYFYPSGLQDKDPDKWDDSALYKEYGGSKTLEQWRYSNINECVRALHNATHKVRPEALFGVSPAGRLPVTSRLYADPRQWVELGIIDYLAPQIYWTIERADFAAFDTVLRDWEPLMKDVPMLIGLAAYRYGPKAKGIDKAFGNISQFNRQLELCRASRQTKGHIWFAAHHVLNNDFIRFFRKEYSHPSLLPKILKNPGIIPTAPMIKAKGHIISWTEVPDADSYALYALKRRHKSNIWDANLVYVGTKTDFKGVPGTNYFVIALNGKDKSERSETVFAK